MAAQAFSPRQTMNTYMQELRSDHHQMMRVIKIMQYALESIKQHESTKHITLLQECLEYMVVYPDAAHHPREDIIFERLAQQDEASKAYTETLQNEHSILAEKSQDLIKATNAVIEGHIFPLDRLMGMAIEYVDLQIRHMRIEEVTVFPLVDQRLEIDDWKYIIKSAPNADNPLAKSAEKEYEQLNIRYSELTNSVI